MDLVGNVLKSLEAVGLATTHQIVFLQACIVDDWLRVGECIGTAAIVVA